MECTFSLFPEIRLGQVDELIPAAGHDSLQHVEGKALCHLGRDARRNGKHHSADNRVDQDRSIMGEPLGDTALNLTWILQPDPAHANGFRHGREVGIFERCAGVEKTGRLLLDLDESERAVVEDNDFDREIVLQKSK